MHIVVRVHIAHFDDNISVAGQGETVCQIFKKESLSIFIWTFPYNL